MKLIAAGPPLQPAQRWWQILAEGDDAEVVRSQQVMGEPMVDGQVVGAVAHQGAVGPDFVVKGTGSVATAGSAISRACKSPRRIPIAAMPRITPCIANQCSLSFTAPPSIEWLFFKTRTRNSTFGEDVEVC